MARQAGSAFVIKAKVHDPDADKFAFSAQKTMYGGKQIAEGDTVFLLASENSGGQGLFARGVVESVTHIARNPNLERQTPRVSVTVRRSAKARRLLGRADLKAFSRWGDGRPQTELNFKLYRQATDKIAGVTASTAAFLERFF
jgi:hypothetical protein